MTSSASPFGAKEYLFTHYGLPGRHCTLDGTDPIETPNGVNERQNRDVEFLAPPPVCYLPERPTAPTRETKPGVIDKALSSVQTDIMVGRKPLSAWDGAVQSCRDDSGTAIGHEREEACEKANP